jgi:AbrB family looped-hinge helix DNA binding protein
MSRRVEVRTKLSSKSRVVVPKAIRDAIGIGPGSLIVVEARGSGAVVVRRAEASPADQRFAVFTEWSGPADTEAYENL